MVDERKLCTLQMVVGIFLFVLFLMASSITEEWINCLNPEVANNIIIFLNFYYKHRVLIGSILNPISITLFLTGLISLQNLKIKRKQSIKEQLELLQWCKFHLIMIYTPEELFDKIQVQDLTTRRLIGAQWQKVKLEKLVNAINTACLPMHWDNIEIDFNCIKIDVKIMKTLRKIENWAENCLNECELMITEKIATPRLDMICSKPWIPEMNKAIKDFIEAYYQENEKNIEIDYFDNQWKERENKVKESAVNKTFI